MSSAESEDHAAKRRRHTSRACDHCRTRRSKCDGKTPCSKCARLGNICSYNSYATSSFGDLRKLRPSAHELQQLVQQNEILTRLFLEIQNASPDSTLQNIRAGSTFGEAAEALSEHVDETLNDQTAPSYLHDQPTVPSNTLEIIDGSTNITTSEARSGSHAGNSLQDRSTWHPSLQRRWQESEIVKTDYTHPPVFFAGGLNDTNSAMNPQYPSRDQSNESKEAHRKARTEEHVTSTVFQQPLRSQSFGNLPLSSALVANGYPRNIQRLQRLNFQVPDYLLLPLFETDEPLMGRVYTDFQKLGRQMIGRLGSAEAVLQGPYADAEQFFWPRKPDEQITAYTWGFDVNRSFVGRFSITLHLASSLVLGRLMRWMLHPCAETYALVPDIIKPTKLQRLIPHAAPVDVCLFAGVRDSLVFNLRDFVSGMHESGIDVSWPHTLNEAFLFDFRTGKLEISPRFAAHVSNVSNWKVGKNFLNQFPDMADRVNLADQPFVKPEDILW